MSTTYTDPRSGVSEPSTELVQYVWEQEDAVFTGDIARLVKAVELTHYGEFAGPDHVITWHDNTWTDVTVRVVHHGTDDQDWMHRELICTWAHRRQSAFYVLDGRT